MQKEIRTPPSTFFGTLRYLGPGLIIAGSIVGSGELVATTKTGAEAGFSLLWLIILGCVIKVFVQVEFGRFSVVTGKTTMDGLNMLPGPRIRRANWFMIYFFVMTIFSVGHLGGMVGGVGQALAISLPLTESGRAYNATTGELVAARVELSGLQNQAETAGNPGIERLKSRVAELEETAAKLAPASHDDQYWATILAVVTAVVLVFGRYGLIQTFSTVMVASFTVITIANLFALQGYDAWAVRADEIVEGLRFKLSIGTTSTGRAPFSTAMMTFGLIGCAAGELITYPYWCLERGYARFTGPRDNTPAWAERARGWMRVMQWDAWGSMLFYTFATVAFYLLGAAILWRVKLNPEGTDMVATLGAMYKPVFGSWAKALFLFGAFAVLYSTYFLASAGNARFMSDALRVVGALRAGEQRERWVRILSGAYPIVGLIAYLFIRQPAQLILINGAMLAIQLGILAWAALFFRYRHCDPLVAPGKTWDLMLFISVLGMILAGTFMLIRTLYPGIDQLL